MCFFKNKLQPLYEQEGYEGISTLVFKEKSMEDYVNRINKKSNNEIKDKITNYVKIIDEINKTNNKLLDLELKKQKIENELLNNPLANQIFEELSKVKNNPEEIFKKLTKTS